MARAEGAPLPTPPMPELAEVEHARRLWDVGLGRRVHEVTIRSPGSRVFRGADVDELSAALGGRALHSSAAKGKQMAFRFGPGGAAWLGLHLGMSGRLLVEAADYEPAKHDHLVLRQAGRSLVFSDPRHFGRVRFHQGGEPSWWASIAPSVLGDEFDAASVIAFLGRRRRAPLKAVLLMQERFPGVGNWMADEILWRARMHPATPAGSLDQRGATALWRAVRRVARLAVDTIDDAWNYPSSWLFAQRWRPGGRCPRCGEALSRAAIGGRTTCWCPRCQPGAAGSRGRGRAGAKR
ncbi:MAG TPA: DNA-formamidopyrimidine glycosylase family protein [Polyangiaceae bacterium]|nr:DNA-formamidopyrimidine glycosylase family protein [Polyangiaceae bacterium]